ncbi:MAG: hypothetical protein ACREB6_10215 [Rhodospirillales bacterium]
MSNLHASGETVGLIGVALISSASGTSAGARGTGVTRHRHLQDHVVGLDGGQNRPHPDEQGQDCHDQLSRESGFYHFRNMAKPAVGCKGKAGRDIVDGYI